MPKKISTAAHVYAYDVRKPIDWRWQRAVQLQSARKYESRLEDLMINRAVKYVTKKKQGEKSENLAYEFPDIYEADQMHSMAANERYMVEALIVAGESAEGICEYLHMPGAMLNTYESLFFDVRYRRHYKGFIQSKVITARHETLTYGDRDSLWKLIGQEGGPVALYSFWERGVLERDMSLWYRRLTNSNSTMKASIAAITTAVNSYTAIELLKLDIDRQRMELEEKRLGSFQDDKNAEAGRLLLDGVRHASDVFINRLDNEPVRERKQVESKPIDEPRASDVLRDELKQAGIDVTEEI